MTDEGYRIFKEAALDIDPEAGGAFPSRPSLALSDPPPPFALRLSLTACPWSFRRHPALSVRLRVLYVPLPQRSCSPGAPDSHALTSTPPPSRVRRLLMGVHELLYLGGLQRRA